MLMILHILDAELAGPFSLHLRFNDGCSATVDLRPLMAGPIFEPLLDPNVFAKFTVDPICKTVCWPSRCGPRARSDPFLRFRRTRNRRITNRPLTSRGTSRRSRALFKKAVVGLMRDESFASA